MFFRKKCFSEKMNLNKCILEKKYSEFSALEKTELFIELFRTKWAIWTIRICGLSIVGIFFMGIYAEITEKGNFEIFTTLSSWVGFILGIIATLFSIISMFLSFYNLEKERESNVSNEKMMKEMTDKINSSLEKVNGVLESNQKELLEKMRKIDEQTNILYLNSNQNEIDEINEKKKTYSNLNGFIIKKEG